MPFRVYGHPRSGNHVLAALLQKALFPEMRPIEVTNANTGHWTQRKHSAKYCVDGVEQEDPVLKMPYGRLMGNHMFPNMVPKVSRAVYVVRDGRDMALSFWNWKKFRATEQADMPLTEFLRTPIDWRGSPGYRRILKKRYVLFDHWRDHVSAWLKTDALWIRYENLVKSPEKVVAKVARHFDLRVFDDGSLPDAVGWNPSGGRPRVGVWRDELPKDSKGLFDKKVPADHPGRWEPA